MIYCKYWLRWVVYTRCTDCLESGGQPVELVSSDYENELDTLGYDRASIVMCHYMFWSYHNIVPCLDSPAWRKADCVFLDNLFDHSLRDSSFLRNRREESPERRTATKIQRRTHRPPELNDLKI